MNKSYHIITFGCQMNLRDSAWLASCLKSRGYQEAEAGDAGVVIINTCSVREKPEKKVGNLIRRIHWLAKENKDCLIAVTGCVAQQLGAKLHDFGPMVRLVAGTDGIARLPDVIEELIQNPDDKRELLDFASFYTERELIPEVWPARSAYVNIMQGCDNFCSYCIVPFTRGRQHSRMAWDIVEECRQHLHNGAYEITLLGQNVNAWGKDNKGGRFPQLLREVSSLPGLGRLRFVTPHPKDMDADTVSAFAELSNLCPRLHLPMQSGSDAILAKMRRRYCKRDFINLVEKLRNTRPDIALSTDLIVGFPGETEADFQDTLSLMADCGFMASFSFCYSDRPGTRASLMPDKIDKAVMAERLARLQELQDKLSHQWLLDRIGSETEILLEAPSAKNPQNAWQGRDPWGMVVNVELDNGVSGQLVRVRITQAKKHSLYGEIINL